VVQLLLSAKAAHSTADKDGWTPLHCAAVWGRIAVVQHLLAADSDLVSFTACGTFKVTACGRTPLCIAAQYGHTALVQLLLGTQKALKASNAAVCCFGACACIRHGAIAALFLAAQNGHTAVVQLLLDAAVGGDAANAVGIEALHFAGGNGRIAVVQLLLNAHAAADALMAALLMQSASHPCTLRPVGATLQ
jgi:ankyrin